jgi:hypothetical protein
MAGLFCADTSRGLAKDLVCAGRDHAVFVRTIWFDEHDQLRVRLLMKLVCNLLQQRLSFLVILRNLNQGPHGRFRRRTGSCSPGGASNYCPEKKPMGDLIVFKPARGGARVGTAPIDQGTVVVFTGVWQERYKDDGCETKRARRVLGRRSGKSGGKPGSSTQK